MEGSEMRMRIPETKDPALRHVKGRLQTKGLVSVVVTLAAVEQVRLYIVSSSEQRTARCIRRRVAIGASDTLGERS